MARPVTMGWTEGPRAGAWTRPLAGGYRLWAQVPADTSAGGDRPVLWVLDGGSLFPLVSATLDWLARYPERSGVSPMLVVAIDRDPPDPAHRYADFSFGPPDDPAGAVGEVAWGGGAAFANLLVGEAFAAVAEAFALDRTRSALLGHSLAGQFALRLLVEQPGLFAVTGAIGPSIWWDREALLGALAALPDGGQVVFLGVGEHEQPLAPDGEAGRRREARRMVSNVAAAGEALSRTLGAARVATEILPGEDHASAVPASLPKFLRFASSSFRAAGMCGGGSPRG